MPDSAMEITLRDVYEAQQAAAARLDAISTQLAQFAAGVTARLDSGQRHIDDLETRLRAVEQAPKVPVGDWEQRLRALERFQWRLVGAFAGINAIAVFAEWILFVHK